MIADLPLPEVARYRNELPRSGGKDAFLHLGFERRGAQTSLVNLQRRAPLLAQQALYWDEALPTLPCVSIISTCGGVLQGDRLAIEITLADDAQAYVGTQAATKIHEMDADYAAQRQTIVLGERAYLEYLPEAIIPFCHARFVSQTQITIAPTATMIYAETLMAGRLYYRDGERFAYDLVSSSLRADRPDGQPLCVEKFLIEPARLPLRQHGVMSNFDIFGNVFLFTPSEHADHIFERVPAEFNHEAHYVAGVSRLPYASGLVYKIAGARSSVVRTKIREFWGVVRQEVIGVPLPREFLWR